RKRSFEVEQHALGEQGAWTGESALQHFQTDESIPVWASIFLMRDAETGEPVAQGTVQRDLREQKATAERLAPLDNERSRLLAHVVGVQEEERRRIAADVHDDTIQVLAAADLRLGLLAQAMRGEGSEQLEQLDRVRTSIREATIRLRNLIFDFDTA